MRLNLLMAAAMLSASLAAHADTVTILDGGVSASVDGNSNQSDTINGNGSVTTYGTYNPTTSFSSTSATASSSQIQFRFNQAFEPIDTSTGGTAFMNFLALSGGLFSITDPEPVFSSEGISSEAFNTRLYDESTETYVYDTNNGGSLAGALTAGDQYTFSANASVTANTDPSLTYDPSISFSSTTAVTPEPSSLALLGTGALGVLGMARLRLSGKGAQPAC